MGGSAMPQTEAESVTGPAVNRLQALAGVRPGVPLDQVRTVVLLLSASRGGSSLVAAALRGFPELLHLQGEPTPLLAASRLTAPWTGADSDALGSCSPQAARWFGQHLAIDVTSTVGTLGCPEARARFVRSLCWRLTAQWPEEHFDLSEVDDLLDRTLWRLSLCGTPRRDDDLKLPLLHVALLRELRRRHPAVNPWYYDLRPQRLRRHLPEVPMATGPPSAGVIEEPPFILIHPPDPLLPGELTNKALVIKSPASAFRLPFYRHVFPNATVRIVHLTRDAGPSIAGLVDGWLFHGFHSHRLAEMLDIRGYADRVGPDERQWWKFDLPPGWREWTCRSLVEVCGWQWERLHQQILAVTDLDLIRVRFEDLVRPGPDGRRAARRLGEWLGLSAPDQLGHRLRQLPLVMATRARQARRRRPYADEIGKVVARPRIAWLRRELGYAS